MTVKNFLITHAFSLISGPLIGVLVYFCHEQLQRAWGWLDAQNPTTKRIAAFVLSGALTPIAAAVGVQVPSACAGQTLVATDCLTALADKGWLAAAVGGAVALVTHAIVKPRKKPPTP